MAIAAIGFVFATQICASLAYYNYYVYAQQWPGSFCFDVASNRTFSNKSDHITTNACRFPENVTEWTNHGLWPSVNESYPNFCNNSWPLEEDAILPLEDDLRARWPSFDGPSFGFWTHEWDKHGTCATDDPSLYGPYNFFKFVLGLNMQYDMMKLLSQKNINPQEQCYSYDDIVNAAKGLFDETVILGCTYNKETRKQYLAQIEICFDKGFKLSCDPSYRKGAKPRVSDWGGKSLLPVESCRASEDICYSNIPH